MKICGAALLSIFLQAQEEDKNRLKLDEVATPIGAMPKLWKDARFWVLIDGKKCGWVRYQFKTELIGTETCFVVDYERATHLSPCERFRMHVRQNEFLSPMAFAYGRTLRDFKIENGKVGNSGFGPPDDPGNLVSFPEVWATVLPFRTTLDLAFSTLDPEERVLPDATLHYSRLEKVEGQDLHQFRARYIKVSGGSPEQYESVVFVRPDRTLARVKATVKYRAENEAKVRTEEWLPVDAKEWDSKDPELNEIRAAAQLGAIADASILFRWNDFEGNSRTDHWTADVSGLYRLISPSTKEQIQAISLEAASADADAMPGGREPGGADLADRLVKKPVPYHGYLFKVIPRYREKLEGGPIVLNNGDGRNEFYFAICAYPVDYPKGGRRTFMVDPARIVWWKDTEGKPVEVRPAIPVGDGWKRGPLTK